MISLSLRSVKIPFFGKKHSLITKELIFNKKSSKVIFIYDNMLNLKVIFPYITALAKVIHANNNRINNCIKNNSLFIGI